MLTTGDKLRVLNANAEVKVFNAAGVEQLTAANAAANGVKFRIEGFGDFNMADLIRLRCRRASDPVADRKRFTVTVPVGLAIGDAVQISIRFKTDRYQAAQTNNFIEGGRPVIFSTLPLAAVAAADIRTAIVAAWTAFKNQFHMAEMPIEVVNGGGGATTFEVFDALNPVGSLTILSVELTRVAQGIAIQQPTSLASTSIAVGNQGVGTGKFLEESVQMAMWPNINPYGIDTTSTQVDLRGKYAQISWRIRTDRTGEDLGTMVAGQNPLTTEHEFTLWTNEVSMMATNGAVHKLTAMFVAYLTANPQAQITFTGAINETNAGAAANSTEALYLATGISTTTAALFIA